VLRVATPRAKSKPSYFLHFSSPNTQMELQGEWNFAVPSMDHHQHAFKGAIAAQTT
jgi:hypothetical protein